MTTLVPRAPGGARATVAKPDRVTTATGAALLTGLFAAAMIPWWPVYESTAFVVCAAVAVFAGLGIGIAGARFRWPAWFVTLTIAAAYLVLGVPAAVPSRAWLVVLPTPAGLVDLVAGAALSWKQLLTVAVPVGSYQALLVPVFLLGLVGAAIAATIAFRSRRPVVAAVPPAVVFVTGIVMGVVDDELAAVAGLAFLVAVIAWLVRAAILRRRALGGSPPIEAALADTRRVLGATALLSFALAVAAVAAVALPVPQRTVARSELQPPFEPRAERSPLIGFRTAFEPATRSQPMFEVSGLPEGAGLRVAALDTYDGVVYAVGGEDGQGLSGRFARVPYRLDQSAAVGGEVRLEVRVLGYSDVWVPGAGSLERIEFAGPRDAALADGFVYNDVTGTAAVRDGLVSGDRYTAWSIVPPVPDELTGLQPGTAVLPPAPGLPDALATLLGEWAPASGAPGERLAAMIDGLHRDGYLSHGQAGEQASRSGHAVDRIAELAVERPMLGDGEQYAVAAALMAREIGFPARVVVGYLAQQPGSDPVGAGGDGAGGDVVFRNDDLQAWIEVQTADGAWLQVDPNPDPREIPERQPDEPIVVSRPQSALPPPEPRTPVEDLDDEPEQAGDDDPGEEQPWVGIVLGILNGVGLALLVVSLIASPFLAIVAAKLRRRRIRRRAPTVEQRIEGGWQEFADTAADFGLPVAQAGTRAEQAASVGGLDSLVLAGVVDRALYAPDVPLAGDDERVWTAVAELRRRLGAEAGRRRSLLAAISLGSLGGYANSRRGGRS
ncbi:transglutaminase family protein [Agromyces aerolatus]|uniref:transglutaminase family protein n=1 Tax=Agromyces sp. LY-1074 TaxID=3074080 RepID=UPI0028671779|nr:MULTISPECIES: transglutaminase-like domain-containing protein [unclassified Agromyces]MDR5701309.1 transglutaminase-like domain-containing protein [Agromyces sp. LY-1074]MDR5707567.1 transglutaminase-like domain-containing protein [Agromyces sp. LY-1358]